MADSRIDELRRRLERDPGSRLFAQLAEELRRAGEVAEAVSVARAGLERHPAYASARLTLGRALLDSGDPGGARGELEAAVRGAPDNILANRMLGEALETLGDLGEALARYRTTLEMAPGDAHVEARVRALQQRLGAPGPSRGLAPPRPPEITKPMPAAPVGEAQGPRKAAAAALPPTVRMHMVGQGAPAPRAPLPPTEAAGRRERPAAGAPLPPGPTVPAAGPAPSEEPLPPTVSLGARTSEFRPGGRDAGAGAGEGPAGGAGVGTQTAHTDEAARGVAGPSEATAEARGQGSRHTPLSSATLAELYFEQGLLERAVEVYRKVLAEEPGNEAARRRLAEIEEALGESRANRPALDDGDDRAVRRRALERTIGRLEALLLVVQRGR